MIKVNIRTQTASREALPKGLLNFRRKPEALRNLQTTLNPVPEKYIDLEWWPERSADNELAANEKYGAEILTLDVVNKLVLVSHVILTKTPEEIAAEQPQSVDSVIETRIDNALAALKVELLGLLNTGG